MFKFILSAVIGILASTAYAATSTISSTRSLSTDLADTSVRRVIHISGRIVDTMMDKVNGGVEILITTSTGTFVMPDPGARSWQEGSFSSYSYLVGKGEEFPKFKLTATCNDLKTIKTRTFDFDDRAWDVSVISTPKERALSFSQTVVVSCMDSISDPAINREFIIMDLDREVQKNKFVYDNTFEYQKVVADAYPTPPTEKNPFAGFDCGGHECKNKAEMDQYIDEQQRKAQAVEAANQQTEQDKLNTPAAYTGSVKLGAEPGPVTTETTPANKPSIPWGWILGAGAIAVFAYIKRKS